MYLCAGALGVVGLGAVDRAHDLLGNKVQVDAERLVRLDAGAEPDHEHALVAARHEQRQ